MPVTINTKAEIFARTAAAAYAALAAKREGSSYFTTQGCRDHALAFAEAAVHRFVETCGEG